ncbi:MAG TPA: sugar-binding domain-containing protein [Rectinemataceae bacterium]
MNNSLLTRIAWLYYYEDKSQQEVGELLGIPRIKVVRLLKTIREQKIVEIKINRKYSSLFELEKEFRSALGLDDITVVPAGTKPLENVALAASLRFSEMCKDFVSIGVGSSRAVSAALSLVEPLRKKKVQRIVTLTGNTMPNYAVSPSNPAAGGLLLSRTLGIDYFNIWAPAIASSREMAAMLRKDHVVASTLEMANSVDCAMIGLGNVEKSVLVDRGFISKDDIREMASAGAVGDIYTHFFDLEGRIVSTCLDGRSITADVPMRCPVVAVAYGDEKAAPILGAIRGGFIQGLVTDDRTAKAVLEMDHAGRAHARP